MADPKSKQIRSRLKKAYGQTGGDGDDAGAEPRPSAEDVVREHSQLVRKLARRYARTSGGVLDVDDLVSVGVMGLLQAHQNYDPSGGKPFRTYAEFRVRGAILDELRRVDPMSQPQRRKSRRLERAINELAHELGREPSEHELADFLDIDLDKLQKMRRELRQVRFVSTDAEDFSDLRADLAASSRDRSQLRLMLTDGIQKLEEREQQVLSLYYFHDMKLREIGEILEVTEARVCQIHKAAVERLRDVLGTEDFPR
ncbi:MAG: sigma-70 family RNA polymerase sigma factor [Myxococcota bacterium]